MTRRTLREVWVCVERAFSPQVPAARLGAFRAIVCLVALYDLLLWSNSVLPDAAAVTAGTQDRPWRPIFLMQVLGLGPADLATATAIYYTGIVALLCGAVGFCARASCAVGAVAFYWWSGLGYSFGKPHHDKVALAITLAALPFARVGGGFAVDALWRRRWRRSRGGARAVRGTPIRLAMVTLAFGYCGAGLAKLLIGGPEWFNGYTLQGIMLGHDGVLSRVVGGSPTLCQLQSVGVVFVQAAFPLALFWHRSRWFFLPMATLFHLMTWMTMDTGPYMRVWLMLFAFVALERVPGALRAWLRGGVASAVAASVAALSFVALVAYVLSQAVAWPLVAAFFASLAVWFGAWFHRVGGASAAA